MECTDAFKYKIISLLKCVLYIQNERLIVHHITKENIRFL